MFHHFKSRIHFYNYVSLFFLFFFNRPNTLAACMLFSKYLTVPEIKRSHFKNSLQQNNFFIINTLAITTKNVYKICNIQKKGSYCGIIKIRGKYVTLHAVT